MRAARHQNPWGRTKLTTFAAPHRLVIPSLAFCLTLLPGHGIKRSRFLLNVFAAALAAFRVHFVFFQGENYFEGFVTIFANVVVHGHGGLPLDCDHELQLELYADNRRLSVSKFHGSEKLEGGMEWRAPNASRKDIRGA